MVHGWMRVEPRQEKVTSHGSLDKYLQETLQAKPKMLIL